MLTTHELFFALQTAMLSACLQLLMQDGQVFGWYGNWLAKKHFEWQNAWIAKPLGLCPRCFAGQVGLWSGFIYFTFFQGLGPFEILIKTVFFTSANIIIHEIWNKGISRLEH